MAPNNLIRARLWVGRGMVLALLMAIGGCAPAGSSEGALEEVWGGLGVTQARFRKPRAMTIDAEDNLYVVDMTGRIQVFSSSGAYLRSWRTPSIANGKPSGLSFDRAGNLLVADTHYFRVLVYTPQGKLLEEKGIGGECGHGPGQFNFVTDAVQDSRGNYYVSEYGEHDRIQKFDANGNFLCQWGGHGGAEMEFVRPNNMAIDGNDLLWVADSCNHRVQVFDARDNKPKLVKMWGEEGNEPGRLMYPYDIVLDDKGHVYIAEFGNHRIQKFTRDGESLACWGVAGRKEGELCQPWALVLDSRGRIHVLDTYNHRVQRIRL